MKKEMIIIFCLIFIVGLSSFSYGLVEESYIKVRGTTDWNVNDDSARFLNQNPDPAEPGEYVEVRVKVENIGSEDSENLIFRVVSEFPFSNDPGKTGILKLGDVDARQTGEEAYILYWKLKVDENAIEGNNKIRIQFSEDDGESWHELDNYYIRIQTHDSIISVNEVSTNPKIINPGEEFQLNITVENMADSVIKDMKTKLNLLYVSATQTIELPFTPISSTNEKVIKKLESGEKETFSFNLITDASSSSGVYKIPIRIQYSDELAKNYTYSGIVGAVIGNEPELFVNSDSIDLSKNSNNVPLTVRFINRGKEDIKFLFAKVQDVEGLEFTSSKEAYVGNIDSDDYETNDFEVSVDSCDKTYKIPMEVEYSDTNNKKYNEQFELDVKVCNAGEESSTNTQWVGVIIVVVIILAALIVYRMYKKKK